MENKLDRQKMRYTSIETSNLPGKPHNDLNESDKENGRYLKNRLGKFPPHLNTNRENAYV
jgi:hypothetical protein